VKPLASTVRNVLLAAPEVGPLQRLRRESILFQQQREALSLFYLESGLVKLTRNSLNGSKLILSVIGSHQLVGEEALAYGSCAYMADAVCLTEVNGYYIPVATVTRSFAIPEFACTFLSYVLARDQSRIQRMEMLALHDVEHRILHGLAELAQLLEPNIDRSAYAIPMTQLEVACFVGATRETTSTTLSNLQDRGLVVLGRRLITTVSPRTLIDAANDRLTKVKAHS
jgi:CRP-like cAMP-binding protein